MGRYIDEILQPGEKVLYSTNAHWMFYLPALAAWALALVFLVASRMIFGDTLMLICLSLAAVAALIAWYWTVVAWFRRATTETDVTNFRIVHKTGFIKRRTFEMSLDKVESVDVNQSILGRIMNYGDVTILGVGEGKETIRTIASPLAFRNSITVRPAGTYSWQPSRIPRPVFPAARSTPPKSRSFQNCPTSGGIPRAKWPRCTRSTRCG